MSTDVTLTPTQPVPRKPMHWLRRFVRSRVLTVVLVALAVVSAVTTYVVITGSESPFGPNPSIVLALAVGNMILLLSLIAVVAYRAHKLRLALRSGSVGSRLQTRMVLMFSLMTMVPTITIALFAALFMNAGIKAWFSEKVNTGLEESVAVAEAYLREHKTIIEADARAMASDLNRALYEGLSSTQALNEVVSSQALIRSLTEAMVIQNGRTIARTSLTFSLAFEALPANAMEIAASGRVVVIADDDKIRAVIRLNRLDDAYLIIGRFVDSQVVNHMENTQAAVNEYRAARSQLSSIQVQFSFMFVLVALLLLLSAISLGMAFASRLVMPITRLVKAAERVRAGDYTTRVDEGPKNDELATLGRAFNRMTNQLATQRRDLMKANRQLDERRRFTEAVLTGVSAGVMALNPLKQVTLINRSAAQLLHGDGHDHVTEFEGRPVVDLLPEIEDLLEESEQKPGKLVQDEVTLIRGDRTLTLHVRVTAEQFGDAIDNFIITFDDITPLMVAQRHAAWADVARRVAHEIKNPLTPIQLSAQRLKRKYLAQVEQAEQENFTKYTDTIIRHVSDIGKMVEEFVGFARMPAPVFSRELMDDLLSKILFSEETAHPDIVYLLDIHPEKIYADCDARQIRQVITNLVKNAAEAIEARHEKMPAKGKGGEITLSCTRRDEHCVIEVKDDGVGFPPDRMHHVLEPYVTMRAKGTGLGLAIVKKIMEDHHGQVELENRTEGGAIVRMIFPLYRNNETGNNPATRKSDA